LINPCLVEPNLIYQKSFESYVLAYQRINDHHYFDKYKKALDNFPGYLQYLKDGSIQRDSNQADSYTSTFWLIDEQHVVGVARIRHQSDPDAGHIGYDISPDHRNKGYGQFIFKAALDKALEIGIKEVILTCNVDNVASRKIIERCNGLLLDTFYVESEMVYYNRYVIAL